MSCCHREVFGSLWRLCCIRVLIYVGVLFVLWDVGTVDRCWFNLADPDVVGVLDAVYNACYWRAQGPFR